MELKDTITLMQSDDFKDRFRAEYFQTKIRLEKLHNMIVNYEADALDFTPNCSIGLLKKQKEAMQDYIYLLEVRAIREGVSLK